MRGSPVSSVRHPAGGSTSGKLPLERFRSRDSLRGDLAFPFRCFPGISFNADSLGIHLSQSDLRRGMALFGGFAAPFESFFRVPGNASAHLVVFGNPGLRLQFALKRRAEKPLVGFVIGTQTAFTLLVHQTETILVQRVTVLGAKADVVKPGVIKFRPQPGAQTNLSVLENP